MKTRRLFLIAAMAALPVSFLGQAQGEDSGGKRMLKWELQDERVAGLTLEMPAEFARSGTNRLDFDFTLKLTNHREKPTAVKVWDLKLEGVSLGGGKIEAGEVHGKDVTLAPGASEELTGHFFMGSVKGKSVSIGLSKSGNTKDMTFENLHGDVLAGIVLSIGTTNKDPCRVYLAKYHYDAAKDVITAYFTPVK